MASWLRLRAERRGQRGVVAAYVHELATRHRTAPRDDYSGAALRGGHVQPEPADAQ